MNTSYAVNRRIRTAVLELLKSVYPDSLDLRALQFALDNLGYPMPESRLAAHLRYLEEKGLAALSIRRGFGFSVEFATLTAKGWDFLDSQCAGLGNMGGNQMGQGGGSHG